MQCLPGKHHHRGPGHLWARKLRVRRWLYRNASLHRSVCSVLASPLQFKTYTAPVCPTACALGSFKGAAGADACTTCSGNLTTRAPGATSASQCVCPTGWSGAACQVCADDFYGPTCAACSTCAGVCLPGLAGNCTGTKSSTRDMAPQRTRCLLTAPCPWAWLRALFSVAVVPGADHLQRRFPHQPRWPKRQRPVHARLHGHHHRQLPLGRIGRPLGGVPPVRRLLR